MMKSKRGSKKAQGEASPSQLIDARIAGLPDWRGETLARVRSLIKQADPEMVEEWKWRGVPVWEHAGIVCTGETYKAVVKLTFAKGASLKDPSGLFNASLEGNVRRAIDFHEGDKIDKKALKTLIRAAVALNRSPRPLSEKTKERLRSVGKTGCNQSPTVETNDRPSSCSRTNSQSSQSKTTPTTQTYATHSPSRPTRSQ